MVGQPYGACCVVCTLRHCNSNDEREIERRGKNLEKIREYLVDKIHNHFDIIPGKNLHMNLKKFLIHEFWKKFCLFMWRKHELMIIIFNWIILYNVQLYIRILYLQYVRVHILWYFRVSSTHVRLFLFNPNPANLEISPWLQN